MKDAICWATRSLELFPEPVPVLHPSLATRHRRTFPHSPWRERPLSGPEFPDMALPWGAVARRSSFRARSRSFRFREGTAVLI